jgi:hypothetical protein
MLSALSSTKHCSIRRDAHAREPDRPPGLRILTRLESTISSHISIGNVARQCSPNSFTLFVSNPTRRPRSFNSRILWTTIQCTPGAVLRQKRPYASMSSGRPSTAGAFSTMRSKYVATSIAPFSSRCQSARHARSRASTPGSAATAPVISPRPRATADLDADVVRLAEEQFEQGPSRSPRLLERADADEQRARDDAAVVEDDGADHVEKLASGAGRGLPRCGR